MKSLKVIHLRILLARIGSPISGIKSVLEERLARDLRRPLFPPWPRSSSRKKGGRSLRILSIDMGIKNLAFCVADVRLDNSEAKSAAASAGHSNPSDAHMNVVGWRRIDLLQELREALDKEKKAASSPILRSTDAEDSFHPSNMAQMAYRLLSQVLLPYEPDIILIERQRYRSSSSQAVFDWTVRVNMLEGMMWSILTTLNQEAVRSDPRQNEEDVPVMFAVDPKTVVSYWVNDDDMTRTNPRRRLPKLVPERDVSDTSEGVVSTPKAASRSWYIKRAKIQLVRNWLSNPKAFSRTTHIGEPDTLNAPQQTSVHFSFTSETDAVRNALCSPPGRRSKKDGDASSGKAKLDDVADCFLQAAAWVAWEGNRLELLASDILGGVTNTVDAANSTAERLDGVAAEGKYKAAARKKTNKKTNSSRSK